MCATLDSADSTLALDVPASTAAMPPRLATITSTVHAKLKRDVRMAIAAVQSLRRAARVPTQRADTPKAAQRLHNATTVKKAPQDVCFEQLL